ncbi:MAG: hypothetical protein AB1410_01475 [Acidobacteriota bacterium]
MAKIDIKKTELVWLDKYSEDGKLKPVEKPGSYSFQIVEVINEPRKGKPKPEQKKADYEYTLREDTVNIAFLTQMANRKISSSSPEQYLLSIDQAKLGKQFVPLDRNLWKIENYKNFLQKCCKIIVETVNAYFRSLGLSNIYE